MYAKLPERGVDHYGSGKFGAPRGNHDHHGIDYSCPPGAIVYSPVEGIVSKLGYPYSNDLSYRYVQVTDEADHLYRVFYIEPLVDLEEEVDTETAIGICQDLTTRYQNGITNHVHLEVKYGHIYLPPDSWVCD